MKGHRDEKGRVAPAQSKVAKSMRGHERRETKGQEKIEKVMGEFKHGKLHSGSKKGPAVKSKAQAVAIAMSEKRKAARGGYKK